MRETALISGIGGQDGGYLGELLRRLGYRVVGLARSAAPEGRAGGFPVKRADLLDETSLISVLREVRPREVYNLAALSDPTACRAQPELAMHCNGLAVIRWLEAIRRVDPEIRFFQASSSRMYAGGPDGLVDEQTPLRPIDPYGASKAFAHEAVGIWREAYGLFACCGILFNHESPRRGPHFVSRKISRAAARIARNLESEVRLGDLDAVRDWGFAGDYVEAFRLMLQQSSPADCVVGSGVLHSVGDFARAAFESAGLDWRRHVVSDAGLRRARRGAALAADAGRIRRLGWTPKTDFRGLVTMMVRADLDPATPAPE